MFKLLSGDPAWVGLLVFIDCSLTFQNNTIGKDLIFIKGIYHGGAAIFHKQIG